MTQFSLHPVAFRRITEASKNSKTELKLYDSLRMRTIALAVVVAYFVFCGFCRADPLAAWNLVYSSPVAITGMAYGNGTFVGVGGGFRLISHDGATWSTYANPPILNQAGIAYGNGVFLTFGTNIYQSTNGLNYYGPIYTASKSLFAAAYGNNTWVFVGTTNIVTATVTSSNWSWSEFQPSFIPTCISYANGNFIIGAILNNKNTIFSSPDGVTWQYDAALSQNPVQTFNGIAYGNGVYVTTVTYDNGSSETLTSSDLVQWTVSTSLGTMGIGNFSYTLPVAFGGGQFVVFSTYSGAFYSSSNGYAWTHPANISLKTVLFGQGTFVGYNNNNNGIYQSGVVATQSNPPPTTLGISTYPGVTINGTVGLTYQIQYTTSLNTNWMTLTNFSLPYSPYLWIDTSTTVTGQRFYRSVQLQ